MRTTARLRRLLRNPFQSAGRNTAFIATGILLLLAELTVLALPWLVWIPTRAPHVLLALLAPPAVLVLGIPLLTRQQRNRFRARLGVEIPPAGQRPRRPGPWGTLTWLGSPAGRRQLAYHLAAAPVFALGGAAALSLWAVGAAAATVYVWVWMVPLHWRAGHPGYATRAAYVTAAGVALLHAASGLSDILARRETAAALALLGPSREERLARRVEDLARRRADLVDAADAERRRIERDLHDGAQQRLVSLAVNLGLAKATMTGLPEEARKVLDEAHREAKEAIAELSDLVRGLHPAVLEDRGLDAALSGAAARLPIPVRLTVDLPHRPSPTVEAVAYFVVSEALANVVKHARATRAEVAVGLDGPTLRVVVTDDGVGGADSSAGTGLAGLAKRVASVDGTLSLTSPAGGPTAVIVELPCAL